MDRDVLKNGAVQALRQSAMSDGGNGPDVRAEVGMLSAISRR
jgi:hypothetical protein